MVKTSNEGRLKAVYILAVSNVVFTLGYGMYAYIFPNFLTSVNATPPQVGIVSTLLVVSMAFTLLPGGILSDRGHRRKLVIASWLLPAFAPIFFIFAELAGSWLCAVPGVVIFGAGWIGVAAVQSYTSEAAPAGKRGLSFGILVSSGSLGLIPSPLVGGLVVEAYGFTSLFLLAFILYTVSTIMVLTIPRLQGDSLTEGGITGKDPHAPLNTGGIVSIEQTERRADEVTDKSGKKGRRSVLRRLIPLLSISCLFMGFVYIGWSYIPLYLSDEYEFGYTQVQIMYTIQNLSSIVFVNVLGKLSDMCSPKSKLALIIIPIVSLILGYWILVPISDSAILPVSFILLGSVGAVFPLIYSTVGELSEGKRVGRTYGVIGTFIYAAEATTPYLGGTLYAVSGQLPFALTLALSPLLFIMVFMAYRRTH